MRFTGNMSISEACKDIREKTEEGGADHSLFRPPNALKQRKGQWLRGDRTFYFYDIISGEELHYRKRHRQMKLSLMNGDEKLVLIDESAPTREVVFEICEKLRLEKPWEEWSLTLGSTRAFLDPVLGLQEQGVTEKMKVWLKKKHFWTDDKIDKSCPMNLSLMYHQARFGITHGEHFVTEDEAISFCALQLQQEQGRFNSQKHKQSTLFKEIDHFFEEKYQKKKKMHSKAFEEWKNLGAMTELDAMYQYMKLARGLATYGVVMFAVGVVVPGKKEKIPELVGVAKSEVLRMDYKTRAIKERWPYMMIKRWAAANDMFTLDFGHKRETYYNCYTNNAAGLGLQIQGYLDIMMRLRKHDGTVTEVNDGEAAVIEDIAFDAGKVFEHNTTMIMIGDSDGEDMDSGEVVGSDDDDPDPLQLPKPMITPGNGPGGVGTGMEDPDNDPEPVPLPKKLLRPGKGPAGAGDRGPKRVFVSDVPTCIDAVDQLAQLVDIPMNPSKVTAIDPDKPRKAFQEGVTRLPRDLENPKENAQDIATTLAAIIKAARQVQAKDGDISLLEAARRVAHETEEILKTARELDDDPESIPLKKRMVAHKSALKGANTYALGAVEGALVDPASEQLLLATAKQLADAVNRMASAAHEAAETTQESAKLDELSMKSVALARVIPAKVSEVAAVQSSQAEINEIAKKSQAAAKCIMEAVNASEISEDEAKRVIKACEEVKAHSVQLMDSVSSSKSRAVQEHENLAEALRAVGESSNAILDSTGDKQKLEHNSNLLGENLAQLIAAGKNLAKLDNDTISLLDAAKKVSANVEDLLATTRNAIEDPKNMVLTREMLEKAQGISKKVDKELEKEDKKALPYAVARKEAKEVAAASAELCSTAREVLGDVEPSRQKELIMAVQESEHALQKMIKAVSVSEQRAESKETQEKMVKSLKSQIKTLQKLTQVARTCVPAIEKTATKAELGQAVEKTATRMRSLVSALQSIPDENAQAFNAIEKALEKETVKIESAMLNAAVGNLAQTRSRQEAVEALQVSLVDLQRAMDVMRKVEASELVASSRKLVSTFGESADASICVAAATADAQEKQVILQKAKSMATEVQELLQASKSEVQGVAQEDDVKFIDAARNVSRSLRALIGTDEAEAIKKANRRFLPDINALLKAAKAASESNSDDANQSLLAASKNVSASLKELMATIRDEDLPLDFIAGVKGLLVSVDTQLGEKSVSRKNVETTQNAVGAVNDAATDLLEVAQNYEEGPDDCDISAADANQLRRKLKSAPAKPGKAAVADVVASAGECAAAAQRVVEVAQKVPKVARSHPTDLAPHVNAVIPVLEELVETCNAMVEILPDSENAANSVACVHSMLVAASKVLSSSKTAKGDPQADETMSIAICDLRKGMRDLVSLTEQATPSLKILDEASRQVAEASRFGVPVDLEQPMAGLAGLEAACERLTSSVKAMKNVASSDPSSLGQAAQDSSEAMVNVMSVTQCYDPITRAVAIVEQAELLAGKIRTADSVETSNKCVKSLNSMVAALVSSMKEVSQNERSTEIKDAIKTAYSDIKPAQQEMVEAAKGNQDGSQMMVVADAADDMVEALRKMASATPESKKSEDLIACSKNVAQLTRLCIHNSNTVAKRPNDGFVEGQLLMSMQDLESAKVELLSLAKSMAPGRSELESVRALVKKQVGEMETSAIAAEIGLLNVNTSKSRTQAQESLVDAAEEMKGSIESLLDAAKTKDTREMGQRALPVSTHVSGTVANSRELAGTTKDVNFQLTALASTKDAGASVLAFLDAALELCSDPNSKPAQKKLLSSYSQTSDNVGALKEALQTSSEGLARCAQAAKIIRASVGKLGQEGEELSYAAAQAGILAASRRVGKAIQQVQRGARGNAPEVGEYCLSLSKEMQPFIKAVSDSFSCVADDVVLKREAERTCEQAAVLCDISRSIAADPTEALMADLSVAFKKCVEGLGATVHCIRDAAVGDKQCRETAAFISKLQADLDSACIFAEAGSLQADDVDLDLVEVNAEFEKSAKAVLARSKQVCKSMESQADLQAAAEQFGTSVETLVEASKGVASAIGDFVEFSQQKDVLLSTKKGASAAQSVVVGAARGEEEDEMVVLNKTLGQELVALVRLVKEAAGAAIASQTAIAKARDLITSAIAGYSKMRAPKVEIKDVADATRSVTQTGASIISASGKNSRELLAALDEATNSISEFLQKAKGADKLDSSCGINEAATALANCIVELLDTVRQRKKDDWESQEAITSFQDIIADRVQDVIACLKRIPGQEVELEQDSLGDEVLDSLRVAIKSISDEGKKLKAKDDTKKGDVGSILVGASDGIISANVAMLKAALKSQEELVARAKTNVRLNVYLKDPKWAEGLMQTVEEVTKCNAYLVATTNRCACADLQNISTSIEELSKAARIVSSNSNKLVASSKAKSDSKSSSLKKLTVAGEAVSEATKTLIESAKKASEVARQKSQMAEKEPYSFAQREQGGELNKQLEIARIERELERSKLAAKIKAEMAESWVENQGQGKGKAVSKIDQQLKQKKQNQRRETSTQDQLRRAAQEGKNRLAKVKGREEEAPAPKKATPKKKTVAKKEEPEDSDSDELAPPPPPDSDDELAPPPPPDSDSDE